jgi:hypothetical protein
MGIIVAGGNRLEQLTKYKCSLSHRVAAPPRSRTDAVPIGNTHANYEYTSLDRIKNILLQILREGCCNLRSIFVGDALFNANPYSPWKQFPNKAVETKQQIHTEEKIERKRSDCWSIPKGLGDPAYKSWGMLDIKQEGRAAPTFSGFRPGQTSLVPSPPRFLAANGGFECRLWWSCNQAGIGEIQFVDLAKHAIRSQLSRFSSSPAHGHATKPWAHGLSFE